MAEPRRGGNAFRSQLAAKRASELAERQFGALAHHQLVALGFTRPRIGRLVRSGRLHPRHPGVFELDGEAAQSSAAQLQADAARQAALEAMGYLVMRFSWDEVHRRPERVAAEVRSAMIAACASPSPPTKSPGSPR